MKFIEDSLSHQVFSSKMAEFEELFESYLIKGTNEWFSKCFQHRFKKDYSKNYFSNGIEEIMEEVNLNLTKLNKKQIGPYCNLIELQVSAWSRSVLESLNDLSTKDGFNPQKMDVWNDFNSCSVELDLRVGRLIQKYRHLINSPQDEDILTPIDLIRKHKVAFMCKLGLVEFLADKFNSNKVTDLQIANVFAQLLNESDEAKIRTIRDHIKDYKGKRREKLFNRNTLQTLNKLKVYLDLENL